MGEATLEVAVGKVQETNYRAAARWQPSWALPGDRDLDLPWTTSAPPPCREPSGRRLAPGTIRTSPARATSQQTQQPGSERTTPRPRRAPGPPTGRCSASHRQAQVRRAQQPPRAGAAHPLGIDVSARLRRDEVRTAGGDKAFVLSASAAHWRRCRPACAPATRASPEPARSRTGCRWPRPRLRPGDPRHGRSGDRRRSCSTTPAPTAPATSSASAALEQRYDQQLRGTPGVTVQAVTGKTSPTLATAPHHSRDAAPDHPGRAPPAPGRAGAGEDRRPASAPPGHRPPTATSSPPPAP